MAEDRSPSARIEALLSQLAGRTAMAARWLPRTDAGAAAREPGQSELALRADDVFPAASLAKLPIAVELARRVDLGAFGWAERFDLSGEPAAGGGSLSDRLDRDWRPTLADLCTLMLAISDNTAANFLLDLVGIGEVNFTMERLGLTRTRLHRRFMDLAARAAGRDNLTAAGDMVSLLALLASNALPQAARVRSMLQDDPHVEPVTLALPAGMSLAHKSGILEDTIHGAGVMAGPGGTCVYCVLTTGQSDLPQAALAVARVLRTLWDAWCGAPAPGS
jgi:beta-lactamase class A